MKKDLEEAIELVNRFEPLLETINEHVDVPGLDEKEEYGLLYVFTMFLVILGLVILKSLD